MSTILLTDYAWPNIDLEREIMERAGHRLIVVGKSDVPAERVSDWAAQHSPEAILTCWAQVSARAISSCPRLRVIARMGVGLDNIDVAEATGRGAWVTNVPDYCVEEVSDHAIALLLAWTRGIAHFASEVKTGRWEPGSAKLRRLSEMTVGVIGFGRIGRRTASKLKAWGGEIVVHTTHPPPVTEYPWVTLEELLQMSDVVIVHVPLAAGSRHLISRERLALMRRGGMLINVSRGGVVDTDAVCDALASGQLAAAGLDVLESEPEVPAGLTAHEGAILTPHIAFSSDRSLIDLRQRACEEVVRVLGGESPLNPCNQPSQRD